MDREEILEAIDKATEPAVMTKPEAVEWLEEMQVAIDTRLEALREEIENEEEVKT